MGSGGRSHRGGHGWRKNVKTNHYFVLALVAAGFVQVTACSSEFTSCADSRTCANPSGGIGGGGSDAGGTSAGGEPIAVGGAAGESEGGATASGTAGEGGASGSESLAGASGEGGAAGAVGCSLGEQRSCAEGGLRGSCAAGIQTCTADHLWGDCSIQPKIKDSCVAGNDDTCNGVVNEGCPCVQGQTRPCSDGGYVGKCAAGKQTCGANATWGACSIAPAAADTCVLGNNDNCSGPPNEGCLCIEGVTTKDCGVCQDGKQTCTNGKTAQYGACTGGSAMKTYYLDADGDGHAVNVSTTVCGPAPAHYITGPVDDCYDLNKDAFPGQTKYFTVQRGDGSFDYNCINGEEAFYKIGDQNGCAACAADCSCATLGVISTAYACGVQFGTGSCYGDPNCSLHGVAGPTQACH